MKYRSVIIIIVCAGISAQSLISGDYSHYTVLVQSARVTLLAARFALYLLDILAKLKGDTGISINTSI